MNEIDKLIIRLSSQIVVVEQAYMAETARTAELMRRVAQLETELTSREAMEVDDLDGSEA